MHVTLGQAAKQLSIGKATLSRYIKQGKISATKQEDGSYRIDASELDKVRDIMRPPLEHKMEQSAPPLENQILQREIDLLRETLAQKDKIIADVMGERDKWSEMALSLQAEKQKLLTDGRTGAKRRAWAWLSRRS